LPAAFNIEQGRFSLSLEYVSGGRDEILGALGMDRTCDLRFRKPLLYPLSYEGGDGAKCGAKFADTPHIIYVKATSALYLQAMPCRGKS